jgi:hypothetical protein
VQILQLSKRAGFPPRDSPQSMTVALILLAGFAVMTVVGTIIAIVAMRKAPEADEDRDGFHFAEPTQAKRSRRVGRV